MKELPSISAVICCYNSAKVLPRALYHLSRQNIEQRYWKELLIVNNCSSDRTEEVAIDQWPKLSVVPLRIIRENQPGLGFARFRALKEALGDIIVFVDDDVLLMPDYLRRVSHVMSLNSKVGALGGINSPAFEKEPPPAWFEEVSFAYALGPQGEKVGPVRFIYGAGMAVRTEAWRQALNRSKISSFLCVGRKGAKASGAGEDYEICIILRCMGWHILYDPELKAQHHLPAKRLTWDYYCELTRGFGKSNVHIECYRLVHEKDVWRKFPLPRSWKKAVLLTVKELAKLWLKPPLGFNKEKKDKEDCRWIFFLKGQLEELFRLRSRYDKNIRHIQRHFT